MENLEENALATAKEQGDEQEWSLILVNRQNPIPAQYDVELEQLSNGERIDIRISPYLQDLFDAARTDGVYPIVASGYRTTEKQQEIMDEKIAEYKAKGYTSAQAKAEAETWVAVPGTSEHQLGLAVDINADGIHSTGNEVYRWLDENSYRFGFIRRYPPDKTEITGVSNEPWHYRYVGIEAATEMYNQGVCLEEYLKPEK
ncbi:serine-type D-Ala-D-Ala carboxypeptidase [Enterococcus faecium 509]|nr:D-alanyl-D-alanine carboxypeptidase VanY [Enterococcus faecium C68]EJY36064.1 serine-type D-Ala-D-Ala carboxypeptidase [Enterococcus faecium 509]